MATRWSETEMGELEEMRRRLKVELGAQSPFPEVVGDRRMLRFLRGHQHNIDRATERFSQFLDFRRKYDMDVIRQNIVYNGCSNPSKFPKGEIILKLVPQTVIMPFHVDALDQPIVLEQFNFSPTEVLKQVTQEEYMLFLLYALEYRALVFEQLSAQREAALLKKYVSMGEPHPPLVKQHNALSDDDVGWGIIVRGCFIRDLKGMGFAHVSQEGQAILRPIISVVAANYPEFLGKSYIVNTPMVFNVLWNFLKGVLDPRTVKKMSFYGSCWLDQVQNDISMENMPQSIGGMADNAYYNCTDFQFDVEPGTGSLWYPGAPIHAKHGHEHGDKQVIPVSMPEIRSCMRGDSFQDTKHIDDSVQVQVACSLMSNHKTQPKPKPILTLNGDISQDVADNGLHYVYTQPLLSRLSLRFRRALSTLCQIYIDPVVYYCVTYKLYFAIFLAVVVGACWVCRKVVSLMVFPCIVYLLLGALA